MFFTQPIVLWLSLLSSFSDALISTLLESFQLVCKQWGFDTVSFSLVFIPSVLLTFAAVSSTNFCRIQASRWLYLVLSLVLTIYPPFPWYPPQKSWRTQTRSATLVVTLP